MSPMLHTNEPVTGGAATHRERTSRPPVPPPEELGALRAVEVLEAVGTPEAKEVLAELATGEQTVALARDAVEAMRRLRQR